MNLGGHCRLTFLAIALFFFLIVHSQVEPTACSAATVIISSQQDAASLSTQCPIIYGSLSISNSVNEDIFLDGIQRIEGDLRIENNIQKGFTTISGSDFNWLGGSLTVKGCAFLTFLDLSDLKSLLDGGITITNNTVLGDVDLSMLSTVIGSLDASGSFTRFDLTKIGQGSTNTVNGSFSFITDADFDCKPFNDWNEKGIFNHNSYSCSSLNDTSASSGTNSSMSTMPSSLTSATTTAFLSLSSPVSMSTSVSTDRGQDGGSNPTSTTASIPTTSSTSKSPNTKKAGLSADISIGIGFSSLIVAASIAGLIWFFKFRTKPDIEEYDQVPREVSWLNSSPSQEQTALHTPNRNSRRAHLYDQLRRLDDTDRLRGGLDDVDEDRRAGLISEIEEGLMRS